MSATPFLYPSVSSLPAAGAPGSVERQQEALNKKPQGTRSDFDNVLDKQIDLNQVREPLKFSAHASQRMSDRKIKLDPAMMTKVSDAVDKAAAKGIEDTLILTGDTALIVSVKNRTVITAMDKASMSGNVFSNIDGAVIL